MTQNRKEHADPADALVGGSEVDALSDVLVRARLRGDGASAYSPGGPFHVAFPPGLARLHFALEAPIEVRVAGRPQPIVLAPADVAFVGRDTAHSIASLGSSLPPRGIAPRHRATPSSIAEGWITGTFRAEDELAAPLLSEMPAFVYLAADRPGRDWQRLSMHLLVSEIARARPGSWVMVSRILDLVLIHALREWAGSDDVGPGWLATALDERLAPALSAIHRHPERPWTVSELAALTRQAPSTFAHRFSELVGTTPAAYLTDQRMAAAARMLESTTSQVGRIATAVGYASEPAFSRAFRRRFGVSPLAWRKGARPEA